MRVVAILQARMGSTRLPGKVMMPLAGKPMLQNIVARVERAQTIDAVVLAPPSHEYQYFTANLTCAVAYAEADENDLVGRYVRTALAHDADIIVRIPCDNPCIDPEYIDQAVEQYIRVPSVFYTNTTAACEGELLDGIGCEVFSMSRLLWLADRTRGHADYREHPHLFFYHAFQLPAYEAALRLDVNTEEDYRFVARIYDHFGHNRFTTSQLVGYLRSQGGYHAVRDRAKVEA